MTITDQQTSDPTPEPLTWSEQVDIAMTTWRRHQEAALAAHSHLIGLLCQRQLIDPPVTTHEQLFVGDVQTGDQVLMYDGWWYVTGTLHGDAARAEGADCVLCLARVGHDALEVKLAGNTHLTVVRCAA